VSPNPSRAAQRIEFTLAEPSADGVLEIFDVTGRVCWRAPLAGLAAGPQECLWDGRDVRGRRVDAGLYFVRLTGVPEVAARAHKLIRVD
jgi:flagellar hook assembly protein FlgD